MIGKSLVKEDIERAKAVSKRDSVYDPDAKELKKKANQIVTSSTAFVD